MKLALAKQRTEDLTPIISTPGTSVAAGYCSMLQNVSVPGTLPRVSTPGWMDVRMILANEIATCVEKLPFYIMPAQKITVSGFPSPAEICRCALPQPASLFPPNQTKPPQKLQHRRGSLACRFSRCFELRWDLWAREELQEWLKQGSPSGWNTAAWWAAPAWGAQQPPSRHSTRDFHSPHWNSQQCARKILHKQIRCN